MSLSNSYIPSISARYQWGHINFTVFHTLLNNEILQGEMVKMKGNLPHQENIQLFDNSGYTSKFHYANLLEILLIV